MITSLGRFLRILRIEKEELLKDMAKKLGVTSAFLSAVENGNKKMPSEWNAKICSIYSLTPDQVAGFTRSIARTQAKIELNMKNMSASSKELCVSFARKASSLSNKEIAEVEKILNGTKKND